MSDRITALLSHGFFVPTISGEVDLDGLVEAAGGNYVEPALDTVLIGTGFGAGVYSRTGQLVPVAEQANSVQNLKIVSSAKTELPKKLTVSGSIEGLFYFRGETEHTSWYRLASGKWYLWEDKMGGCWRISSEPGVLLQGEAGLVCQTGPLGVFEGPLGAVEVALAQAESIEDLLRK